MGRVFSQELRLKACSARTTTSKNWISGEPIILHHYPSVTPRLGRTSSAATQDCTSCLRSRIESCRCLWGGFGKGGRAPASCLCAVPGAVNQVYIMCNRAVVMRLAHDSLSRGPLNIPVVACSRWQGNEATRSQQVYI